jgi:hypothetical protein
MRNAAVENLYTDIIIVALINNNNITHLATCSKCTTFIEFRKLCHLRNSALKAKFHHVLKSSKDKNSIPPQEYGGYY